MAAIHDKHPAVAALCEAVSKRFGPGVREFAIRVGTDEAIEVTVTRFMTDDDGQMLDELETMVRELRAD